MGSFTSLFLSVASFVLSILGLVCLNIPAVMGAFVVGTFVWIMFSAKRVWGDVERMAVGKPPKKFEDDFR